MGLPVRAAPSGSETGRPRSPCRVPEKMAAPAVAASSGGAIPGGAGPRTASMFACVTTLCNTLMGVSVVGVAGGFARAGCAVGTFFLALFACLSGCGLHLLARSSMTVSAAAKKRSEEAGATEGGAPGKGHGGTYPPPSSFRAVALVGAPRWAFLIDVAVALKCFGVATSYLVVVGDLMPTAMTDILGDSHEDSFLRERRFWVTAGFVVAAPLAFSRTLGALKYTATLAISLVVFLAGMVLSFWILPGLDACPAGDGDTSQSSVELLANSEAVAQSAATEGAARGLLSSAVAGVLSVGGKGEGEGAGISSGFAFEGGEDGSEGEDVSCFEGSNAVGSVRIILQTLPIFVFCFTCHQNIFTICNEIVRPTPARVDAVIVCAMLVAMTMYLSLSWGAYATFGVGVDGDLLQTYPRTGLLTAARISVSILVLSCYPLQAHPSRVCILSTWKAFSADMKEAYSALATSDAEGGRQQGTQVASSVSLTPDSPLASGGASSRIHPDIVSNISSSSSSSSSNGSSSGDGRAGASLGGERGRRRVVGGGKRVGADIDGGRQESPQRQAQREAELETLLSDAAPPARQLGGDVGVDIPGSNRRSGPGDSELGVSASAYPRASGSIVDVESTDGAFSSAGRDEKADEEEQAEEAFWTSPEGFRHVLVTGAFLGLSYTIAMAVGDLGVLLEVVGATGSTTIAFILPGLLYLKVHPEPHPKRSLATLQLAVGLLIIPVALTFIALGDAPEGRR